VPETFHQWRRRGGAYAWHFFEERGRTRSLCSQFRSVEAREQTSTPVKAHRCKECVAKMKKLWGAE
jgi:hypothetical protein